MKTFKRYLAILLAVMMVVSCLPVGVMAEGTEEPASNETGSTADSNAGTDDGNSGSEEGSSTGDDTASPDSGDSSEETAGESDEEPDKPEYEPLEEYGVCVYPQGEGSDIVPDEYNVYYIDVAGASSTAEYILDVAYRGNNVTGTGELTTNVTPDEDTSEDFLQIALEESGEVENEEEVYFAAYSLNLFGIGGATVEVYADGFLVANVKIATRETVKVEGNILTSDNFSNEKLLNYLLSLYPSGISEEDASVVDELMLLDIARMQEAEETGDISIAMTDLGLTVSDINILYSYFEGLKYLYILDSSSQITDLSMPCWTGLEIAMFGLPELTSFTIQEDIIITSLMLAGNEELNKVTVDGVLSALSIIGSIAPGFRIDGDGIYEISSINQELMVKADGNQVNLNDIVGSDGINKVEVDEAGCSFDPDTGIVTLGVEVDEFSYTYTLENDVEMSVWVLADIDSYYTCYFTPELIEPIWPGSCVIKSSRAPLFVVHQGEDVLPVDTSYDIPLYEVSEGENSGYNLYSLTFIYGVNKTDATEEDVADLTVEIKDAAGGDNACISITEGGELSQRFEKNEETGEALVICCLDISANATGSSVITVKAGSQVLLSVPFSVHESDAADNYKATALGVVDENLGNCMLYVQDSNPALSYTLAPEKDLAAMFAYIIADGDMDKKILPVVTSSNTGVVLPGKEADCGE